MDTFHVITEIPVTGEATFWSASFTVFEVAEIWVDSVVMCAVHFSFVAEQTCIRRESHGSTIVIRVSFGTDVWFEV